MTANQEDILSPEQLYKSLEATLAGETGVDVEVLEILKCELLHISVDERVAAHNAGEKLMALALKRAEDSEVDIFS